MYLKKRAVLVVVGLFLLGLGWPWAGKAHAAKDLVFTSGIDPATSHGLIAKNLGLFKKYGLNVTVKKFSSARAGVRTIYAGENDAGVGGDMNVIGPLAQGNTTVKIVGQLRRGLKGYGAAVAADNIKKPADLTGKKVGILQGSPVSHLFFEKYIAFHKVKGVQRVWLRPQEQLIAFSKGDIDALFIFSPWWQKSLGVRKGAHVLAKDYENNLLNASIIVVIHKRLQNDPKTVQAILRAIKDADDYLNSNRAGTVKIMQKEINLKPDLINSILDSLEQRLTLDSVLVNNLCQGYNFLKFQGKIKGKKEPDWNGTVLEQYLRTVAPDRVSIKKPITCG